MIRNPELVPLDEGKSLSEELQMFLAIENTTTNMERTLKRLCRAGERRAQFLFSRSWNKCSVPAVSKCKENEAAAAGVVLSFRKFF